MLHTVLPRSACTMVRNMKRSPKPGDMNQRMYAVAQEAAGLTEPKATRAKDPKAVERGRLGGQARAKALTTEERATIARVARAGRQAAKERREAEQAVEMRKRA
jgi:hypothetical protein